MERNATILLNGDFLDLMGGKYDPRNTLPGGLRPEYRRQDYFDAVIEDAVGFLKPYASNIALYAQGNHETNVKKRQHTDPSKRMVEGLSHVGSPVKLGGYSGYVKYRLSYAGTEEKSWLIHYHHGYGGNAPRSKGVLSVDMDSMKFPDADFIVRGHDHNKWHVPISVERMSKGMKKRIATIHHIRCGSYKLLGDGFSGWETEKGFGHPRLGGYWLFFGRRGASWVEGVEEAV